MKPYFELDDEQQKERFSRFQKKYGLIIDHQESQQKRAEKLSALGDLILALKAEQPKLYRAFQEFLRAEYAMQSYEKDLKEYMKADTQSVKK